MKDFYSKIFSLQLTIFIKLAAIGVSIFTARWLNQYFSESELANYNIVIQFASIITGILSLGIPQYIYKIFGNKNDSQTLSKVWSTMVFAHASLLLLGFLIHIGIYFLNPSINLVLFFGLYIIQFLITIDINIRSVTDAYGRTWQFNITDVTTRIGLTIFLYLGVTVFNSNINLFILSSISVYFIQLLIDWWWHVKNIKLVKLDFTLFSNDATFFWYISLTTLVVALSANSERLFLDFFGFSDVVINGYVNAYRILEVGLITQAVTLPSIAGFALKDKNKPNAKKKMISWLLLIFVQSVVTMLGLMIFGGFGVSLIDPLQKYTQISLESLPILLAALIPSSITGFMGSILILTNHAKREFASFIVFFVVSISLYLTLIPLYGHFGAAWATLIGSAALAIAKTIVAWKEIFEK